jgi:hypothetical protein
VEGRLRDRWDRFGSGGGSGLSTGKEAKTTQGRKHSWALGDYSVLGASGLSGLPIAEG